MDILHVLHRRLAHRRVRTHCHHRRGQRRRVRVVVHEQPGECDRRHQRRELRQHDDPAAERDGRRCPA